MVPSVKMSTLGLRTRVDILTSGHIILECRTDHHASFVYYNTHSQNCIMLLTGTIF